MARLNRVPVVSLYTALLFLSSACVLAGPPPLVPYKAIPDPPDNVRRHITVKTEDRGLVWLLAGFLSGWAPGVDVDMITKLKPQTWRSNWPL